LVCSVRLLVHFEVFIGEHGDKYREREANFRAKKQEESGGFLGGRFRAKKQGESGGNEKRTEGMKRERRNRERVERVQG